ncbi:hypothetical protein, partial [uncultured Bacteroides sp.]|uniref:hypothetical protein n=1 Tax=uncultured Bacteroides sp. TaxID=162156 RepID=UPI00259A27A2
MRGFPQSSAFYLTHQSKSVEITPISNLGFANSTTACCGSSPVPALALKEWLKSRTQTIGADI